jgi:hypothetical protein
MPRDSSGAYTLPSGNPVVTGTIIESIWANDTMEDIAVQMNNVLTRDGLLGPTLPFVVVDGTEALPGLAFALAPSTGLYRFAPNTVGMTVGGDLIQSWSAAGTGIEYNLAVGGNITVLGTSSLTGSTSIVGTDVSTLGFFVQNMDAFSTTAAAGFMARNSSGKITELVQTNNAFTALPIAGANAGLLYSDGVGGLAVAAVDAVGGIRFATGGIAERMRLTAAGDLGLGVVPSGTYKLQVSTTANNIARFDTTNASGGFINISLSNVSRARIGCGPSVITGTALNDLSIRSDTGIISFAANGSTEMMQLDASGNLGIGITPGVRLHASDSLAGVARLNSTAGSGTYLGIANNTTLRFRIGVGSSVVTGAAVTDLGLRAEATGNILFSTNGATESMRLSTAGYLGVGTPSPSSRLHVVTDNGVMFQSSPAVDTNFYMLASGTAQWGIRVTTAAGRWVLASMTAGIDVINANFNGLVGVGRVATAFTLEAQGGLAVYQGDFASIHSTGGTLRIGYEAFSLTGAWNFWTASNIPISFGVGTGERARIISTGMNVQTSVAGGNVQLAVVNNAGGAGSGARVTISCLDAVSGDPSTYYVLPGSFDWTTGINHLDFSYNIKTGSSVTGATGFRITATPTAQTLIGGTAYNVALDPGASSASIPIGGLAMGRIFGALAAVSFGGTVTFTGAAGVTILGAGGATVNLTSGTWRFIGRDTNATNVDCTLWVRTA